MLWDNQWGKSKYCNGVEQSICLNDCTSLITPISTSSLNMVENALCHLGAITYSEKLSLSTVYKSERGSQNGRSCPNGDTIPYKLSM